MYKDESTQKIKQSENNRWNSKDEIPQSENNNPKSINAVVVKVFGTKSVYYENAKQNELKSCTDGCEIVPYKNQSIHSFVGIRYIGYAQ